MKKHPGIAAYIAATIVAGLAISTPAFSDGTSGFVTDGAGNIVRDGTGECVTENGIRHHHDFDASHCSKPKTAAKPQPAPAPAPAPAPVVEEKITLGAHALFDTNKSTLRPEGISELDTLVTKLKSFKALDNITVTGHTDSRGAEKYNQGLSERRAAAVKDFLVSKGIPAAAVDAQGKGESSPVADNKTAEGRQQNRRVELQIKARK